MNNTKNCKGCPHALDERSKEILLLLAEGMTTNSIAEKMYISQSAVKHRVIRLMDWFDATNRTHLVSLAIRRGIIDLGDLDVTED